MAQINAPKAFDEQSIDPKTLDPIKPLVEHMNQNFDQLIRALSQQLTLSENSKGKLVVVSAMHNQETKIELQGKGVIGISVLKCEGDGVSGLKYTADQSGRLSVTFEFMNAVPIKTRSATFSTPHLTYEVGSSLNVRVGDRVLVTSFGNKNNNGEYLVVGKTSNTLTVYNPLGVAETKADFTGTGETSRQVTLFIFS